MSLLEKIKITNFKTIPLIKNNEQSNLNANTLKSISNKKNNSNIEELDFSNDNTKSDNYTISQNGKIKLNKMSPELEEKKQKLIKKCKEEGIKVEVAYSTRGEQEQDDLYAIGRTKDQNGNELTKEEINKIKIIKEMLGKKKCAQESSEILNINKETIIQVRDMIDEGTNYDEISKKLNINKNDIYLIDYLKNGGTTTSEMSTLTGISNDTINQIKNLIIEGNDIDYISTATKIDKNTIIELKCMLKAEVIANLTDTDKLTAKKIINEINNEINNGNEINFATLSKKLKVNEETFRKIYYMEIKDTTTENIANCFNQNTETIENISKDLKDNKSITEIANKTSISEKDIKIIREMLDTSQESEKVRELFNIKEQDGIKKLISTVTNATGYDYTSNHQWGTAFDVKIYDKNGNIIDNDNLNENLEKKVGEIGEKVGLEWGGNWQFEDPPHFQLKNADSIRKLYTTPKEYADTWE